MGITKGGARERDGFIIAVDRGRETTGGAAEAEREGEERKEGTNSLALAFNLLVFFTSTFSFSSAERV